MTNFENIGFSSKLKKAIGEMGYKKATEVQARAIPLMISGQNVVSKSFTGSGKTAAFGLALSERLLTGESKAALILCPTRELALQVKEELQKITKETGFSVVAVYGGTKMSQDERILKKRIDILCATPGRLIDHFEHRRLDPKMFDTVVLDEADRMLDMGFIRDIKHVLAFVRPKNTHLFSATLTGSVAKLIERYIPKFEEVIVQEEIIGKNILQRKQSYAKGEKFPKLVKWLREAGNERVLIFVSTKKSADSFDERLKKSGFRSTTIHGDKSQNAREYALQKFKDGKKNILIATDVAARGLQVDNVEYVINLDRARDEDTHKHRIGRTGRMGDKGLAITFVPSEDKDRAFWKDFGVAYKQGGARRSFSHDRNPRRSFSHERNPRREKGYHPSASNPHGSGPRRKRRSRRSDDVNEFVYRS